MSTGTKESCGFSKGTSRTPSPLGEGRGEAAFLVVALLLPILSYAETSQQSFEKANRFYKEKNYQGAIGIYDSLSNAGYSSASLYFNLGNACFKTGNVPQAVLNYERAKKLNPSDEDIEFNLKLANLQVVDRIEPLPELFFLRWIKDIVIFYSSDGWAKLAVALIWLALVLGGIFIFVNIGFIKRMSFFAALLALVFSVSCALLAWSQYNYQLKKDEAIVFERNVYIKSAPDVQSTDLFIIRQGVKVKLLEQEGDWQKIQLADGKVGWMKKDGLEVI